RTGSGRTFKSLLPVLSKLSVHKREHRVAADYIDSAPATTRLVLRRCVQVAHRRCGRYKQTKMLTHHDAAGTNVVHVGRLKSGRYRPSATPALAGVSGSTVTLTFRVP